MNATAYAFLGLTAMVAVLVAMLAFAVLRFFAAARDARRQSIGQGESALLAATLEDAVARLKAQERAMAARADASDRLRTAIVASLTSGLIVVDAAARVQILNPAARRILQLPADHAPPDDGALASYPALRDVIAEALRTHEPIVRRSVTVERPQGPMHLGVTVSPLAGENGLGGAICLFSDLTAVIALEEQLRLKEALARLGELTAGLAHEFRNGLATIHGYARLLDPAVLPPAHQPYLEGIRAETDALGEIVTKFLNFAKPERLTLAPLALEPLLRRAAEDVPKARVVLDGRFGVVNADEVLLRQAFSNLLRNSVEACDAAGCRPEITITSAIDGSGQVVLSLRDNGPGLDTRSLPKLFQPFFTTRPGGTGLGLAIVQKVIVSHNGRIIAANHPGGGAVFQVVLPAGGSGPSDS